MRLTKRPSWERLICSYMVAAGIPAFTFDGLHRRFRGVKGFSFVRILPHSEGGWAKVPFHFRRYETERNQGSPHPVVMFVTSAHYGPNIEDSFVITRLDTFATLLVRLVESDPGRYLGKE
ncbi:MAG: hypothetical protein KGN78_05540 [Actinomycetales bacterium]|nr:hypothetical protein [Actinomycetales bacterium]